jgi:predicted ATPase
MVFTDIEGSTRLLHELGQDVYRDALAEHRRLVREAFARYEGYEVDYEGDAFFYAFQSPHGAVAAVRDAMASLADGPIRIRVGVHAGEPALDPPKYVGIDIHTAARIMSVGHGGQVLLSRAALEKAGNDFDFTDLGEHRLKDLDEPVSLVQLGSERFPPLKTISNTNLPRPVSSFVGRERELEEVVSLLQDGGRLVTLSGPGGAGKTRLAIEAAAELVPEFRSGVFWVGVAPIRDPALVTETIAQTLGSKNGLSTHIGERDLLLLLDCLEHVVDAAPELASLVERCPNLRVLVTSRERLRVRGEVEYSVPPLADQEAVELFSARAGLLPDPTIGELCRRLDNLPLAIELAAARASVLSPKQILDRLGQRLDLLKGGRDAEARHQTLRSTIAWSYELLSYDEQQLLAHLSVLAGGCTLESGEAVASADVDTLQSLVDKSLVVRAGDRFSMLETVREYAAERLVESGKADAIRERQALHFLNLVEDGESEPPDDGISWFDRLEAERDNLRAALDWATGAGAVEVELRLATALREFWAARGPISEGLRRLEEAVRRAGDRLPDRRLDALRWAALSALRVGDNEAADRLAREALTLARELGDTKGEVSALIKLSHAAGATGDQHRARSIMEQAVEIARESGDPESLARALLNFGVLAANDGDFERSAAFSEESIRAGGDTLDAHVRAIALHNLGFAQVRLGNEGGAGENALKQALEAALEQGDHDLAAACLENLSVAIAPRDPQLAATILGAAQAVLDEIGAEPDDDAATAVRSAAGDELFERAYAEGREISLRDAASVALGDAEVIRTDRAPA